ncbi:MAG: hypothetical protein Q8K59_03110 [Nitrosomonas sp.]|nr:hypothetical protein [Nitrosomonas sp.]
MTNTQKRLTELIHPEGEFNNATQGALDNQLQRLIEVKVLG